MVVVQLTTDNREPFREYQKTMPWFGTAPEALLQGFAQIPEIKVHVVTCTQRPMAGSPVKLADNIWFHSLHVPKIGWMRTGYQGCVRAARRRIAEVRPDIVHGQGTERDCALSAIWSGFPNVLTVHGNMRLISKLNRARPFTFPWLAARLEAYTLPRSDGIVCITNYTREAVAKLARRTWVVPNAVDQGLFSIKPSPEPLPVILCVGNISYRKNQNAFIHSLDALRGRLDFVALFLGIADRADAYTQEFFRLLESRPWCRYEGFADREKLKSYFQRASLLALPSLEDNCPMAVLEAMAAGVPVIAARVGGVPDLIEADRTGLFCDPVDLASMSGTVARLLEHPERGHALASEAKQVALSRFHPAAIARGIL